jgi:hypothetical protein
MTPAQDLYDQMQGLLAGQRSEDCIQVLCDCLCYAIGFAAEDLAHADRMFDSLPADLKAAVRINWDHLRDVRARSAAKASHGADRAMTPGARAGAPAGADCRDGERPHDSRQPEEEPRHESGAPLRRNSG